MKQQLADAWNTARRWFYRTFLPHKVEAAAWRRFHAGVDRAAAGETDFTVEATYRLDGHKPVELLSTSVLHRDGTKTTFPREDGNEAAL